MSSLCERLSAVQQRIQHAAIACGRKPDEIHLLAVSKTQPVEAIAAAWACGQRAFGENYAQELYAKATALTPEMGIEWHFIGPVQANKTRLIAAVADVVHAVERERILQRLNDQRPDDKAPLQICLQLNVSGEASKSGVSPAELLPLAQTCMALPRLQLRGLMAIPAPSPDIQQQRQAFAQLRQALEALKAHGYPLDTLSMGMSDDLEAAICEGATWVRIGTAIFGQRSYPQA
ncbi:YggS family pyridoxal phosphate-dependent enzyme [Thiorhodospira sibirica]|uniref:YggS family pyridoxal phosphate-dependent enzyme n=1 Tax=Thiorhodospira sibirica TaxID=154347 RepID=UPI00022C39BE|nr:YggS family pyridoxal phosphate-dependent enzyme [Thiorhodospira sibirica]